MAKTRRRRKDYDAYTQPTPCTLRLTKTATVGAICFAIVIAPMSPPNVVSQSVLAFLIFSVPIAWENIYHAHPSWSSCWWWIN